MGEGIGESISKRKEVPNMMVKCHKKRPAPVETEQVKRFVAEQLPEYCSKPDDAVRPETLAAALSNQSSTIESIRRSVGKFGVPDRVIL